MDTNILVYAHDRSEGDKQLVAASEIEDLWASGRGVVSTQVLQEFYSVVTRKWDPPLARREARDLITAYAEWRLVQIDAAMIFAASVMEEKHSLSFWDALIIEAAQRAGAGRVLSEDMQHGRRIGGIRLENPFLSR